MRQNIEYFSQFWAGKSRNSRKMGLPLPEGKPQHDNFVVEFNVEMITNWVCLLNRYSFCCFCVQKSEYHKSSFVYYRIFGGLRNDIKRKAKWYISDYKDVLHVQCIASVFFMYFACLTPIITFGGLLGAATDNNMV